MKTFFGSLAAAAACLFAIPAANAHMYMTNPPAFRYAGNPKTTSIDYNIASPLTGISQYPCKGYQNDATGTDPVATWAAGSAQSFTLAGGASHGGGSCQASISADNGVTWHVIKSYIGNCPTSSGGTFDFILPAAVPSGNVLFGWTWFNKIGNREMYMDCAAITVTGGGSGLDSSYPAPFIANIEGTCQTVAEYDVVFPNPGSVVETDPIANLLAPIGDCGPSNSPDPGSSTAASGSSSITTSGSYASSTATVSTAVTTTTLTTTITRTSNASSTAKPSSGTCVEGTITCNNDGTWSMCGSGIVWNMGAVAAGMKCTDGTFTRAQRSKRSEAYQRRGDDSTA
ncbi:hypothetical protein RUND412_007581 [Rhizina undulata]